MAAMSLFSVAHGNGQRQQTSRQRKPIYTPGFQEIRKKKITSKKKFSRQVAAIGGKLKVISGDLHTHG